MFVVLRRSLFNNCKQNQICKSFAGRESSRTTAQQNRSRLLLANKWTTNYSTSGNMSKSALVILAPGAEEMEFVIAADVLRRAGIKVTIAGLLSADAVKCSRDVCIVPDTSLELTKGGIFDAIVLPGGLGGAKAMSENAALGALLKEQEAAGRIVAAICAAPTALLAHGICSGKSLTSYPSVKGKLDSTYKYVDDEKVVQDGNLITSRGPGTAFDFGLKLAEVLAGADKAKEVAKGMLLA
ncbi:PREDICTED: protein deglycase DJ-1 [Rhagoletis zephyria]|uniref:protein deglycase DJ-1 n=1 Tax=Rhagoletis zephyria TaxID=28612 RepID=UPI0008119729|nr:PREDICTED: protein deglycase DJ-1 [Rhagoletis zephyria]